MAEDEAGRRQMFDHYYATINKARQGWKLNRVWMANSSTFGQLKSVNDDGQDRGGSGQSKGPPLNNCD